MHVLMIAQFFSPDFGGASTRAYNVAKGLLSQGCEVTVVCGFPHYPHGKIPTKYSGKFVVVEELEGIRLIRTWVPGIPHSSNIKRIFSHLGFIFSSFFGYIKAKKIDIILAMNPNLFSIFPAYTCKLIRKKNIIRNMDDSWPETFYDLGIIKSRFSKKILNSLASFSYKVPVIITPISEGYVPILIEKYNIPKKKIIVIEHGVDTKKFFPSKVKENSNTIVMYSGALNVGYDFDTVIKSAKILEKYPIQFIIRGTGDLKEKLQKMKTNMDIKNLEINTELLPEKELITLLNLADIFLLPMSSIKGIDSGLPTKIMEYQALGKPIICISNGEAGKYISETNSGLVTKIHDPDKLAELILNLIKDPQLASKLGKNGLINAQTNLTIECIGKRFLEIIKQHSK